MTKKPIIGIPCRSVKNPSSGAAGQGNWSAYLDSITRSGGIPLLIPLLSDSKDLLRIFELCDGFLFSGGEDINPQRYNSSPSPKLGDVSDMRDQAELELYKLAFKSGKSILGICRGCQLINVAMGGTLYQDIPSEVESTIQHSGSQWTKLTHDVKIKAGSKLYDILGCDQLAVNSLHHQSAKAIGNNLKVSAVSEDGIIEGIESTEDRFLVAVQWHPEVLWPDAVGSKEYRYSEHLFKAFIQSIKT